MSPRDKPLVWMHGELKTPPFSAAARIEAGYLLRLLQKGVKLSIRGEAVDASIPSDASNWRKVS